jgi:alkyl hydroperoxide reductase subunit D
MTLEQFKDSLGEHAKDTRVNLSNILSEEGAPGLTQKQIDGVALACTYATLSPTLREAIESETASRVSPEDINGAKAAASIMAMNNIYYRFMHLAEDDALAKMPAKLRMQVIGKPPIDKPTFELMCLGVSALSGCGNCIKAHIHEARKAGFSDEAIQSVARIASVLNAASVGQRI